jgi:hypothetical protein
LNSATEQPVTVVSDLSESSLLAALHNGDMTMNSILKLLDRAALGLLNLLVVAGAPLAAVGLISNAF